MQNYNFVVERDADMGLYVGHIPGWPGAHRLRVAFAAEAVFDGQCWSRRSPG
jgi:predicted RNase H-like HicB family nuclease